MIQSFLLGAVGLTACIVVIRKGRKQKQQEEHGFDYEQTVQKLQECQEALAKYEQANRLKDTIMTAKQEGREIPLKLSYTDEVTGEKLQVATTADPESLDAITADAIKKCSAALSNF